MDLSPVCDAAKGAGHSGPSLHWWLSLTATDQGTWFSGMGAFAAAVVALGIALVETRRRQIERRVRGRLIMASLYSPMSGILEYMPRIASDAQVVCLAAPDTTANAVTPNVARMKKSCETLSSLVGTFSHAEAIYLKRDFGVSLAVAMRDVELLSRIVTAFAKAYDKCATSQDFARLPTFTELLQVVPAQARAVERRIRPFVDACQRELGTLDPEERPGRR